MPDLAPWHGLRRIADVRTPAGCVAPRRIAALLRELGHEVVEAGFTRPGRPRPRHHLNGAGRGPRRPARFFEPATWLMALIGWKTPRSISGDASFKDVRGFVELSRSKSNLTDDQNRRCLTPSVSPHPTRRRRPRGRAPAHSTWGLRPSTPRGGGPRWPLLWTTSSLFPEALREARVPTRASRSAALPARAAPGGHRRGRMTRRPSSRRARRDVREAPARVWARTPTGRSCSGRKTAPRNLVATNAGVFLPAASATTRAQASPTPTPVEGDSVDDGGRLDVHGDPRHMGMRQRPLPDGGVVVGRHVRRRPAQRRRPAARPLSPRRHAHAGLSAVEPSFCSARHRRRTWAPCSAYGTSPGCFGLAELQSPPDPPLRVWTLAEQLLDVLRVAAGATRSLKLSMFRRSGLLRANFLSHGYRPRPLDGPGRAGLARPVIAHPGMITGTLCARCKAKGRGDRSTQLLNSFERDGTASPIAVHTSRSESPLRLSPRRLR